MKESLLGTEKMTYHEYFLPFLHMVWLVHLLKANFVRDKSIISHCSQDKKLFYGFYVILCDFFKMNVLFIPCGVHSLLVTESNINMTEKTMQQYHLHIVAHWFKAITLVVNIWINKGMGQNFLWTERIQKSIIYILKFRNVGFLVQRFQYAGTPLLNKLKCYGNETSIAECMQEPSDFRTEFNDFPGIHCFGMRTFLLWQYLTNLSTRNVHWNYLRQFSRIRNSEHM